MAISVIIDENSIKKTILVVILAFLIFFVGHFPGFVENYYSVLFYPLWSKLLRFCFGWISFSVGDVVYFVVSLLLIRLLIVSFNRKKIRFAYFIQYLCRLIRFLSWGYIFFNLCWGLNYHRQGISNQIHIKLNTYSVLQITDLKKYLIYKTNECRRKLNDSSLKELPKEFVFDEAAKAYLTISSKYVFFQYQPTSLKSTEFNWLADYIGFTGYYNPFTGEAQVRTDVPHILLPFIACHEIAHQLGYASEREANFVGYLAASQSTNVYFNYSVYLELLNYAMGEEYFLYAKENSYSQFKAAMLYNKLHIDPLVQQDRKAIKQFFKQRQNRFAPVSANLYDQFLKLNQQVEGIASYNEVLAWLIAYKESKGKL